MRDRLVCIVDRRRELIREDTVGALQYEVTDFAFQRLLDAALNSIVESDGLGMRHDAPRVGSATRRKAAAARAGINVAFDAGDTRVCNLTAAARAGVSLSYTPKLFECRAIRLFARALIQHGSVPFHAARFERFQNVVGGASRHARRIEVVDPYEPRAVVGSRFEVASDRCNKRSEMQRPGR